MHQLSTNQYPPECPMHTGFNDLNKAGIRNQLDAVLQEAMDVVYHPKTIREAVIHAKTVTLEVEDHTPDTQESTHEAAGLFRRYVVGTTTARHRTEALVKPRVPIGQYGEGPAARLLTGAIGMIHATEQHSS